MTRRRPGSNVGPENHNVGPENHNVTVPEETALTVTFAGSGDAFGSGGRFQACIHLRGPGGPGPVLLDCGATALSALTASDSTPARSRPYLSPTSTAITSGACPSSSSTASSPGAPDRSSSPGRRALPAAWPTPWSACFPARQRLPAGSASTRSN